MINIFNRTVLFMTPSAEESAEVWSSLREAGIPYDVKIGRTGTGFAKPLVRIPRGGRTGSFFSSAYNAGGVPNSWVEGNSSEVYYIIYVLKKDLERAKEICGRGGKTDDI